jgi:hypothetical protein|nr:MAG TPA: hypothetical protein [Caudoviricetes sp.]
MAFGNFVLTNFGQTQLVKAHKGKTVHFSRMALGDGDIGSSSVYDVTALKSEKLSLLIDDVSITEDAARITVMLSSALVDTGFNLREMALMAIDPDTSQEAVYAYNRDNSAGEYIPDKNSSTTLREYLRVNCNVEGVQTITFAPSGNPLFITREELENEVSSQISNQKGVAGGLALYDDLKAFMNSKGAVHGLAEFDVLNSHVTDTTAHITAAEHEALNAAVQSATIGSTAVTKSGTTLQLPAYPTALPANGGTAADATAITSALTISTAAPTSTLRTGTLWGVYG